MLGDISPQTVRITQQVVAYPGRDHVCILTVKRFDGRTYKPVDMTAMTRVILSFPEANPVIVYDSSVQAVFTHVGTTLTVDLSDYAMPASVLGCQIILYDAEHPAGQVLVDEARLPAHQGTHGANVLPRHLGNPGRGRDAHQVGDRIDAQDLGAGRVDVLTRAICRHDGHALAEGGEHYLSEIALGLDGILQFAAGRHILDDADHLGEGAVNVALWAIEAPPERLPALTEARLPPVALVVLWLMRTTVVVPPAEPEPEFLSIQLAETDPPGLAVVGVTDPFRTRRSGVVPSTVSGATPRSFE